MVCNERKSKGGLNEKTIRDTLNNFFSDQEEGDLKVDQIWKLLQESRTVKSVTSLKVGKIRKKKGPSADELTRLVDDNNDDDNGGSAENIPEHMAYLYNGV